MAGQLVLLVGKGPAPVWWAGQPVWYGAVPSVVAEPPAGEVANLLIELPQTLEQLQHGCSGQQVVVPVAEVRPRFLT